MAADDDEGREPQVERLLGVHGQRQVEDQAPADVKKNEAEGHQR